MTNPDDPIAVKINSVLFPKDMPKEWADKVKAMTYTANGLTKREYFAAMAMQAMVAGITRFREDMEWIIVNRPKDIAELSCLYADTLIDELNKEGPK